MESELTATNAPGERHAPDLSVVIPMYNEAENVKPLLDEVFACLENKVGFEVVVVDDGSVDDTLKRLAETREDRPRLSAVRHQRNYGQSAGLYSGIRVSRGRWIATLDGDGQNDPADILRLMEILKKEHRPDQPLIVVGARLRRQDRWVRRAASKIANVVRGRLLQDGCRDTGCGLKLFLREDFLDIPHFDHMHRFLPALFRRNGGRVINVTVNHRPRIAGRSKYGILDRLGVGITDLFGVMWLRRRPCYPEVNHESK